LRNVSHIVATALLLLLGALHAPATAAAQTVPAAPTHLAAQPYSNGVLLFWDDNDPEDTEYRVEMRLLGGTFQDIGGAGDGGAEIPGLEQGKVYIFRVRARNAAGFSAYSNEAAGTPLVAPAAVCLADTHSVCLAGQRFKIQAHWRTGQGLQGMGHGSALTADTGTFWFFSPANVEMVVKVLDACALNRNFWVFAGGLTNVEVVWTVTDTRTGFTRAYLNPQGAAFLPVQETRAFDGSCP
jgi:hypothetical protein